MKNIYKISKILLVIIPLVFGVFSHVSAQVGGCQVITASLRESRVNDQNFYSDSNRPYVYVDIHTTGCAGQVIEVSITELDDDEGLNNANDDDINGTNGIGEACAGGNNTCMDNRPILIPASGDITLALIAGEDECEAEDDPDCNYYVRINDGTVNGINDFAELQSMQHGTLSYSCDGACETYWQYLGVLTNFQGTHLNDPDDSFNGGGDLNGGNNGGGDLVGGATTTGQPTIIDLSLTNPLAGTIDTIPQLLQKIVEIIIKIAIPLIAMAIVYAGLLFVTARGDEEQLKKAKNAFTFAIVGGLILLASWLIADAIRDALTTINQ